MAGLIYGMCALTALLCAWLLLQAWRRSRYKLLFWSALCFAGLTVNNMLLVVDKLIFPAVDINLAIGDRIGAVDGSALRTDLGC